MRELGQQQQPLRLLAPLRPLACRPPRPPPQIWDLRQEGPTLSLAAHAHEVLAADWCKYNDCIIATGSVDKTIKARAGGDVVCGLEAGQPCYVWNPSIQYPSQLSQLPLHVSHTPLPSLCCHRLCRLQVWDVRMPEREVTTLFGHSYAVRRVLFSPHVQTLVASCRRVCYCVWWREGGAAACGVCLLSL